MILTGTFNTYDNKNTYTVTIGDTGVTTTISDPTEDIYGDNKPDLIVMFDPDPVIINTDRQDLTKRIIISQATINLVSNQNMTDYLFAYTNRSIPVTISNGSNVCFFGYVDPLQFNQGYAYTWEPVQVTATDPLGALEQLNVGDLTGIDSNTTITSWGLMMAIFAAAGITSVNDTINPTVKSAMQETNIKLSIFFGETEDDWMNLYDTLTEICKYFNLYVAYYNNAANVSCTINESAVAHNISSFKDAAADSSTSISVDDTYSQVTITAEIDPVEDIVVGYDNDDYLHSQYNNMDKYMTEYISEGEGRTAYDAFFDLITKGETNYDKGYCIDNFCWVMKNNAWDFGSDSYITQGYTDQRDVLTYLKNNSGKGAIIGFGRGNKLDKKDDSPTASVPLTNYLVISVNGTYDNSDAGGEAMKNMIRNANPVCTYKGLSAPILSPSDPTVINYIVISGNILLNPLQPLSGPKWDSEADKLTNTIQDCIDAKENKSWPETPVWHHTVPISENEDGEYYQQVWHKGVGIQGFLDNSKNQRFEYKYDSPGSSVDTISKLPILACELKVGDKYCVELLNEGQDGVGKFVWLTESECNSKGIPPVFTIGINPKPDDKIVGQSFSIQNNVNYMLGINKTGTAIPIKASDKLAGEISFKILGPYNTVWNEISKHTHHSWIFFEKTTWSSTQYYILQYIQSIMISNFKIETVSDNGLINEKATNADNDLVYASDMNPAYVEKLEEDLKICTPLTIEECKEYGVKYQISNSYIYKTDNSPFYGFAVGDSFTKPEECLVDYYYKEYCTPAKMITTALKASSLPNVLNGTGLNYEMMKGYITGIYPGDSSAYRIMSYETSLKDKTTQLTLREYKTKGNTQI